MARDTRTNRNSYNLRCKYYKGLVSDKKKLTRSEKCLGVFYCKDLGAWGLGKTKENGYQATSIVGRIETVDIVTDLKANDFVYYDGNYHLVVSANPDDSNTNKEFSRRPVVKTTIDLRR